MIGTTDTFLVGNAGKRGYNAATIADINANTRVEYGYQFFESSIPVATVADTLFDWTAIPGSFIAEAEGPDGPVFSGDHDFLPVMHSKTGHIFGVHKTGYAIHQYKDWLLDEVALLLDQDLSIGSAATLNKGNRAFVTVETPDNITGPGGIEFRPFLVAATSHDGSLSTVYKWSAILPVCRNTFAAALASGMAEIRIRHTKNGLLVMQDARDALGIIFQMSDAFSDGLDKLLSSPVTDRDFERVLDRLVPVAEDEGRGRTVAIDKRTTLTDLWKNDLRVAPWTGTAFGVVQAFSTATQHEFTVRGRDREARNLGAGTLGEFDKTDRKTLHALRDLDLIAA